MKLIIIAIGTELTSGQIINSNAAYLSKELENLGAVTCAHLTVADQHQDILETLSFAMTHGDLILVTGGLGPTTDDFTRKVISDFFKRPLEFYAPSWDKIKSRIKNNSLPLGPSQKQQAYYPQGAEVISNQVGTADAFYLNIDQKHIYILPGPPSEIKYLFENTLKNKWTHLLKGKTLPKLYKWQCLGIGESDLGDKVEAALADSPCITGYRAHFPYVEVKVWIPSDTPHNIWTDRIGTALAPWVVLKDEQDAAQECLKHISKNQDIQIIDQVTEGHLQTRMAPFIRHHYTLKFTSVFQPVLDTHSPLENRPFEGLTLALSKKGEQAIDISLSGQGINHKTSIPARFQAKEFRDKNLRYWVEQALLTWTDWLVRHHV